MTNDAWMWFVGEGITIVIAGLTAYISLIQRVTKLEAKWESHYEATLNDIGRKVAKHLHSPDDHLGIDSLLDKYMSGQTLECNEWIRLKKVMEQVQMDEMDSLKRWKAEIFHAICDDRIRKYIMKLQLQGEGIGYA